MRFLSQEFNKKTKKDLCLILNSLGVTPSSKYKQGILNQLINEILLLFKKNRQENIPAIGTVKQIQQKVVKNSPNLANFLHYTLKFYIQQNKIKDIQFKQKQPVQNLMNRKICVCLDNETKSFYYNQIICSICKQQFHRSCLKAFFEVFECPFCFSSAMDPLNQVKQILFQSYLQANENKQIIEFQIPQLQTQENLKIDIRSIRFDGKNNYQLTWPDAAQIRLNEELILQLKPLAINSSLKKRKDESKIINLKNLKKKNTLSIIYTNNTISYSNNKFRIASYSHLIGIFLIKPLKNIQLVKIVQQKKVDINQSNTLLASLFKQSKQQISIQRLDISLRCVFSSRSIQLPARGKLCKHIKCFDLKNMIAATAKSRRWKCPICKERAHELMIDPLIDKIITQNKQKRIKEIQFQKSGNFNIINEDSQSQEQIQQNKAEIQKQIQIIDIQSQSQDLVIGNQEIQLVLPENIKESQIHQQLIPDHQNQQHKKSSTQLYTQLSVLDQNNNIHHHSASIELTQNALNSSLAPYQNDLKQNKMSLMEQNLKLNERNNGKQNQVIKNDNKKCETIIIIQSQEETQQYRQLKEITIEKKMISQLTTKKFSESCALRTRDIEQFFQLAERILIQN